MTSDSLTNETSLRENISERTSAMTAPALVSILKKAARDWIDDDAPTHGAALAYYSVFSLAPLILIAIGMASLIVGQHAARMGISDEVRQTLGTSTADAVETI